MDPLTYFPLKVQNPTSMMVFIHMASWATYIINIQRYIILYTGFESTYAAKKSVLKDGLTFFSRTMSNFIHMHFNNIAMQ